MTSQYQRIPRDHFRLLELVSNKDDRGLHFRFVTAPIDASLTRPSYTAISYAWANDATIEFVYIENQPVRVRANVWSALHCLKQSWTYVWLDALCINFNDTAERNEQARIMDSIYSGANAVSVWLGATLFDSSTSMNITPDSLGTDINSWQNSLKDIANRPYWSRSWAVSEYLLAQQVHLYYGQIRINEHDFQNALFQATKQGPEPSQEKEFTSFPPINHLPWRPRSEILQQQWQALHFVNLRPHTRYAGPVSASTLYDLITTHAYTKSSDPRDKIFSLLPLLNPTERRFLARSLPDYNLTEEQVTITTLAHLRHFAGERPLRPVLKAFRISSFDVIKLERICRVLDTVDYMCSENPAQDVKSIIATGATVDGRVVDELEPLLNTRRTKAKVVTAMSTLDKPFYEEGLLGSTNIAAQSSHALVTRGGFHIGRILAFIFVFIMMLASITFTLWSMWMIVTGQWRFCGWIGKPNDHFWQGRCRYMWRFGPHGSLGRIG